MLTSALPPTNTRTSNPDTGSFTCWTRRAVSAFIGDAIAGAAPNAITPHCTAITSARTFMSTSFGRRNPGLERLHGDPAVGDLLLTHVVARRPRRPPQHSFGAWRAPACGAGRCRARTRG